VFGASRVVRLRSASLRSDTPYQAKGQVVSDPTAGLELREADGGALLPVQAQPKAGRDAVVGVHAGRLKVAVTQAPEKGKANAALVKLLAKSLGVSKSRVTLTAGETSSQKTFHVTGVTAAELRSLIAAALA
jgi:uncharacterized protein (TIGR00251 family)